MLGLWPNRISQSVRFDGNEGRLMAKGAMRYKNLAVGKQQGELARFRVLGGPDHGAVYVITMPRVTIGRGEENDVIFSDIKVSRRHLELTINMGVAVIRDLGSSHGVYVNGSAQKQVQLKSGDKIGLGETVAEFILSETGATQMIQRPPLSTAAYVGTGMSGLTQFIPRQTSSSAGNGESFIERNKKVVTLLAVLMAVAALLPQVEERQKAKRRKYLELGDASQGRSISSLVPPQVDASMTKNAENYFKEGFREYRAKNYLRAQVSFETALQIFPEHSLARIYLQNTKKEMEDEAKEHIKDAKRDEEANRLRSALQHYGAIQRLYLKDQSNPLYREAESKAKDVQTKIKNAEKIE
jgi:hypothetical protein